MNRTFRSLSAALLLALGIGLAACTSDAAGPADVDARAARFLVQAQEAFEEGAGYAALMLADSARAYAPELADVHFLRGQILTSLQRLAEADSAYARAAAEDPAYRGVYLNRGNNAYRRGQLAEALSFYRRELERHPSRDLWLMMGRVYTDRVMPDSAEHAYRRAIALDDSSSEAYLRLGYLYKDRGDLERAVEMARRGYELEPDDLNHRYALGSLLMLAGEEEEAARHLRSVVEARPWHYWATYNLGSALTRLGRAEEGGRYLQRAEELQANLAEIEFWQSLARSNPDQFMLWVKLSDALRRTGRSEEAREASAVALTLAPNLMVRHVSPGQAAEENSLAGRDVVQGHADRAIERYERLLESKTTQPDIWLNLGILYAATGRIDAARGAWQTALRLDAANRAAATLLVQLAQKHKAPPPGARRGPAAPARGVSPAPGS